MAYWPQRRSKPLLTSSLSITLNEVNHRWFLFFNYSFTKKDDHFSPMSLPNLTARSLAENNNSNENVMGINQIVSAKGIICMGLFPEFNLFY